MRYLKRLIWAGVFAGAFGLTAAPAAAQQGNVITGTGGQTLGGSLTGSGGLGGLGGGGIGTGSTGTGGLGGMGNGSAGSFSGTTLTGLPAPPKLNSPSTYATGNSGTAISSSNSFASTFANPMWQGRAGAQADQNPGGFGQTLYTSTGTGAGGRTGTGGIGRTGGIGGGYGGGLGGSMNDGTVVALPVQISYPAVIRFPVTPVAAPQLQTDLSGIIGRSGIANPAGVQVTVEGSTVTLRGTVRDEEEARLVIGMVRLTPGIRGLKNELTFTTPTPVPPKQ
jgi:BON domain